MNLAIALGAGAISSISIEAFFRVVKYKDTMTKNGPNPRYMPFSNYQTVSEYVSGGNRRWFNYTLFRFIPPLIVITLTLSLISRYGPSISKEFVVFSVVVFSASYRDGQSLLKKITTREKLLHLANMFILGIAGLLALSLSNYFNLSMLAPSTTGVVDNLWGTLLVAMLVVLYLDATNMAEPQTEYEKTNEKNNYILNSYNKINIAYEHIIESAVIKNNCSKPLLYALLINENMNRPRLLRVLENLFVSLTGRELTVGLAQVKSRKPLSDIQSIEIAASILSSSDLSFDTVHSSFSSDDIYQILNVYNPDWHYSESVREILQSLQMYVPQLFAKG